MTESPQNKSSTHSQESGQEIIDLLEFEVSRLENEQQRPGWTKWALVGASASCVWLLLDQFESHTGQIKIAAALFLYLIWNLVWDALNTIKGFLSFALPPAGHRARFWLTNKILAEARLLISAKFVEKLCLLAIVWTCPLVPRNWLCYLAIFIFCSSLVMILVGLLLTYGRIPISIARPKHPGVIIWVKILGVIPATIVLIGFISMAANNVAWFTIPELRISLLLFAFSTIAPLFLIDKIHHPFLAALLDLRRKLALREIDYESAKRQLNIYFEGMNAAEVLRENVDAVLAKYRLASTASDVLIKEANALISSGNYSSPQEVAELKPLVWQIKPRLKSVEKMLGDADEAKANLKDFIAILAWMAPSSEAEMQKLFETVQTTTAETKKAAQSKIEETKNLLSEVKLD